jgi:hypothetical protein
MADNKTVGLITPDIIEQIAGDIRVGAYAQVAASRAGISKFTFYRWLNVGQAAAEARASGKLRTPPDLYEQFYLAIEAAKAEARFSAENRVFQDMPFQWLKNGYARTDWREANHGVAQVVDELERRIAMADQLARMRSALLEHSASGEEVTA